MIFSTMNKTVIPFTQQCSITNHKY